MKSRKEILKSIAGQRLLLGGYLDLYMEAHDNGGTVQVGLTRLAERWGCTTGEARGWLDKALDIGLLTRLDQSPDGSTYAVLGISVPDPEAKYSGIFEEAWKAYPRSRGHSKSLAYTRWKSLVNRGWAEEALLEKVGGYAAECRALGTEEVYAKHMSSFLNHSYLEDIDFITEAPAPKDPNAPARLRPADILDNMRG